MDLFYVTTTDKIEQSAKWLNNLLGKCPFFPAMLGYSRPTFSNIVVSVLVGNKHLFN